MEKQWRVGARLRANKVKVWTPCKSKKSVRMEIDYLWRSREFYLPKIWVEERTVSPWKEVPKGVVKEWRS